MTPCITLNLNSFNTPASCPEGTVTTPIKLAQKAISLIGDFFSTTEHVTTEHVFLPENYEINYELLLKLVVLKKRGSEALKTFLQAHFSELIEELSSYLITPDKCSAKQLDDIVTKIDTHVHFMQTEDPDADLDSLFIDKDHTYMGKLHEVRNMLKKVKKTDKKLKIGCL